MNNLFAIEQRLQIHNLLCFMTVNWNLDFIISICFFSLYIFICINLIQITLSRVRNWCVKELILEKNTFLRKIGILEWLWIGGYVKIFDRNRIQWVITLNYPNGWSKQRVFQIKRKSVHMQKFDQLWVELILPWSVPKTKFHLPNSDWLLSTI